MRPTSQFMGNWDPIVPPYQHRTAKAYLFKIFVKLMFLPTILLNSLMYVKSKHSNSTTYRDEFPFKSLHFLLTDFLRLLKRTNTCPTVYYTTSNTYTADTGTEVQFGKFIRAGTSQSSETEVVESDGGTVFNISSCSVVNVEENTCKSEELQALISPAEVFTVQNVRDVSNDEITYKEITLTHSCFLSNHNCSFFHR
ncbi:erythroblast NAD(P)(+)--arginine ADP-ribosyltransferase-like [Ictalurus furcatus]|uniref:erythroblast NAD(P)(+)--arginine ADP-ribosyltransferase-like n=1 Tax=Ictalurus furcatus TaxID=66913 RepID=UPI0023504D76|nr:erythroblast NAD(P)(+)--arginine ADP-ribosyltransferase-like [Ictalurus furcatus]